MSEKTVCSRRSERKFLLMDNHNTSTEVEEEGGGDQQNVVKDLKWGNIYIPMYICRYKMGFAMIDFFLSIIPFTFHGANPEKLILALCISMLKKSVTYPIQFVLVIVVSFQCVTHRFSFLPDKKR